ncbi:MAG: single-stranded DNA-binding protein [Oscillospiraceae bacterium]|nr:single-stranded DNA-binding protein [Oscillospiraceae bacterium]
MNKVVLTGRLTNDPEMRRTQSGKATTTFSLAVDRMRKDDGADFPMCVAWEKTAELLCTYVKKGHKVGVVGRLQTRNWTDNKGEKRYTTEVVVESVEFLEKRADKPECAQASDYAELEDDDSELPF